MNESGDIVMVVLKLFEREQMFDIRYFSGQQIIHSDYPIALFDKAVAQVRSQKSGGAGY
jgi:hypothetical protein